jgi:hypothetical protein
VRRESVNEMMTTEINSAIAERAMAGQLLNLGELQELDAVDVLSLGMLADDVRRARIGATVTFRRVLDASLTAASTEQWAEWTQVADELRLAELPATLAEAQAAITDLAGRVPAGMPITGFSLADIVGREWGSLGAVLVALRQSGLHAIAEAPVDLVTPDDVGAVVAAGLSVGALTVQRPSDGARVALVERFRIFLEAQPSVTTVAPLSREQSVTTPTTGYHDVRLVALVRIGVPAVRRLQVDWQQYGPKLAQVALTFGADHLDRVSLIDDPALGRRRTTLEDVRRNIVAAGYSPGDGTAER